MTKDFEPITHDVYIPSIGADGKINYTWMSKDLFNQCVLSGAFSSPSDD